MKLLLKDVVFFVSGNVCIYDLDSAKEFYFNFEDDANAMRKLVDFVNRHSYKVDRICHDGSFFVFEVC